MEHNFPWLSKSLGQQRFQYQLAYSSSAPSNSTGQKLESLRPGDAIWWHRYGSTLAQVMTWCRQAGPAPSHYLNQCCHIVHWTLRNKLQWNFNRNANIFIQENVFECVVCEMAAILSRPQRVKWCWFISFSYTRLCTTLEDICRFIRERSLIMGLCYKPLRPLLRAQSTDNKNTITCHFADSTF